MVYERILSTKNGQSASKKEKIKELKEKNIL